MRLEAHGSGAVERGSVTPWTGEENDSGERT